MGCNWPIWSFWKYSTLTWVKGFRSVLHAPCSIANVSFKFWINFHTQQFRATHCKYKYRFKSNIISDHCQLFVVFLLQCGKEKQIPGKYCEKQWCVCVITNRSYRLPSIITICCPLLVGSGLTFKKLWILISRHRIWQTNQSIYCIYLEQQLHVQVMQ